MDPEVAERARGVFDALAVRGRPFEDIQASDFADWRMFFRFVKDASADPTTALGELNATSFLGKHDISMSAWGKSVKERSPLFKEEFDKLCLTKPLRHRNDLPYFDYCSRVFEGADDLTHRATRRGAVRRVA